MHNGVDSAWPGQSREFWIPVGVTQPEDGAGWRKESPVRPSWGWLEAAPEELIHSL